jgi:hypothetical protein
MIRHCVSFCALARLARLALVVVMAAAAAWAQPEAGGSRPGPRTYIFFPPTPPPLDRPIARTVMSSSAQPVAPLDLAPFVNEPFYAPLSTRMVSRTLTDQQRSALEQYRTSKVRLQAELRAELERLQAAEPEERRTALKALADKQAPALAELEKSAEQLRQDLILPERGWSDRREWRLGNREKRGFSPMEIAQVMRGYAYYHPGLLPAQRRLLREVALELMMAGDTAENAQANQPHLFFQPELARILPPDDLPPELATKLAAYQSKKALLKKELYDAVHVQDGGRLSFLRNPLRSLPEKQSAKLAELESLAEEIRGGLGQSRVALPPAERSPLPGTLTARLATLLRERAHSVEEATAKADAVLKRAASRGVRVVYQFEEDGLKYVVAPPRGGRGATGDLTGTIEEINEEMSDTAGEYGRRLAGLLNELNAIRREAATALGSTDRGTIDSAMMVASRSILRRQSGEGYRDYRLAVFEPGLAPAQRRLLFDGAIERLELPLPRGEPQPTRRAATW